MMANPLPLVKPNFICYCTQFLWTTIATENQILSGTCIADQRCAQGRRMPRNHVCQRLTRSTQKPWLQFGWSPSDQASGTISCCTRKPSEEFAKRCALRLCDLDSWSVTGAERLMIMIKCCPIGNWQWFFPHATMLVPSSPEHQALKHWQCVY